MPVQLRAYVVVPTVLKRLVDHEPLVVFTPLQAPLAVHDVDLGILLAPGLLTEIETLRDDVFVAVLDVHLGSRREQLEYALAAIEAGVPCGASLGEDGVGREE